MCARCIWICAQCILFLSRCYHFFYREHHVHMFGVAFTKPGYEKWALWIWIGIEWKEVLKNCRYSTNAITGFPHLNSYFFYIHLVVWTNIVESIEVRGGNGRLSEFCKMNVAMVFFFISSWCYFEYTTIYKLKCAGLKRK